MKILQRYFVPLLCSLCCAVAFAENSFSANGRLERIQVGKGWLDVLSDVKVPSKNWDNVPTLSAAKNIRFQQNATDKSWLADVGGVRIEQTVTDDEGKIVFRIKATPLQESDGDGVYFWLDMAVDAFAGGMCVADEPDADVHELPLLLPEEFRLYSGATGKLFFIDKRHKALLSMQLDPPVRVTVQDGRKWSNHFSALVNLQKGPLEKRKSAELKITLATAGDVDDAPAHLSIDANEVRYRLDGFGGNYCFVLDSPVTQYTRETLNAAFARTRISMEQWASEENSDPASADWKLLAVRDKPGSDLRKEFELLGDLCKHDIPCIVSIWDLPEWMYAPKAVDAAGNARSIDPRKWPALLENIGAYLLYAKKQYHARPKYLSFNEGNLGINVLFSPEEHRDAIKRIGAYLASLKVETKMLLGDVSHARDTTSYLVPTMEDPEALKFAGAVAFHSWGGATPAQYTAWAELAEKLKLPLLVSEAGVDPFAWKTGQHKNFSYGVDEVAQYQQLLLYARPQALLFWEFTDDYPLIEKRPIPADHGRTDAIELVLTERYAFQKHWCNLTPPGSDVLKTESDNGAVLLTAFSSRKNDYTFHLSNSGWARQAQLTGIPKGVEVLNVVRTRKGELFQKLEAVTVNDGKLTLDLPAQSLTTLTTMHLR